MDVEGLRAQLPMKTLLGWIEFYKQHPFGDDWQQAATVAAAVTRPHVRGQVRVQDFIPKYKRARRMSAEELTRAIGGMGKRGQ